MKTPATKPAAGKKATKATKPPAPAAPKKPEPQPVPAKPAALAPRKVAPKAKPAPRPTKPPKLDLAQVRARLETERSELQDRIDELERDANGLQSEMTGEVGLMGDDFADAGTATFDRERDLSIRNNIRDLIDQVERALDRLNEGTYGTCERCGRYIDAARLRALPHALMCLDCKRREERIR